MQNTAPFNTDVPEFQPSREAPIYPAIVRRYPCQEDVVSSDGSQGLRSLAWKIQQPDSSMVWTSVKLVMPMDIHAYDTHQQYVDTRVASRLPACNVALSESVMRVFRDTSLSLNGKVFNEVNYYRDVLDACYRGVGPQSYGDNHSLKPVVTRALAQQNPHQVVQARAQDGSLQGSFVRIDDIKQYITSNNESLLDNNGPFLERARLWQDGLGSDGSVWHGDVSAYLEVGPFQARARKGNTAVPYIKDFHLRLNFNQVESRYDQLRQQKLAGNTNYEVEIKKGRIVAPYLLEFGTIPNMHITGETIDATGGFLGGIRTFFSAKPYLEVTYTKFLDPMRSSYLLRCYERQYQQSLPRFKLPPNAAGGNLNPVTARVTSRLLSYPTKIYLYAEVADEWKGSYLMGGVRRSCQLDNIHCRINQRPDVIYNPSQEECFETFQRHTNSSLEYGSWRKSPIYVFTPSDLRQSDMYANDARITWMEWDAAVSLTQLENDEKITALGTQALSASGYIRGKRDEITGAPHVEGWAASQEVVEYRCDERHATVKHDDATCALQLMYQRDNNSADLLKINFNSAEKALLFKPLAQMVYENDFTGASVPIDSNMDIQLTTVTAKAQSLDGLIWAIVKTKGNQKGVFITGSIIMIPHSYRFTPNHTFPGGTGDDFVNPWSYIQETPGQGTYAYNILPAHTNDFVVARGVIADAQAAGRNTKEFGMIQEAPNSYTDVAPGPFGYKFDAAGLRNKDGTFGSGNATYTNMGQQEFKTVYGADEFPSVDENKVDPDEPRWCCFMPPPNFLDTQYFKWRANTYSTFNDITTPVLLYAGHNPVTGLGQQRVYVSGAASNAAIDTDEKTQFTTAQDPPPSENVTAGRRLAQLIVDPLHSEDDIEFDYQLKALYEYGNCQYEFNDQGIPTRTRDNLLPVGPSPGIPTF